MSPAESFQVKLNGALGKRPRSSPWTKREPVTKATEDGRERGSDDPVIWEGKF